MHHRAFSSMSSARPISCSQTFDSLKLKFTPGFRVLFKPRSIILHAFSRFHRIKTPLTCSGFPLRPSFWWPIVECEHFLYMCSPSKWKHMLEITGKHLLLFHKFMLIYPMIICFVLLNSIEFTAANYGYHMKVFLRSYLIFKSLIYLTNTSLNVWQVHQGNKTLLIRIFPICDIWNRDFMWLEILNGTISTQTIHVI